MNTISRKDLHEKPKIYREQLVTIEDLESLKTNLLEEIRKILKYDSRSSEKKYLKSFEVKKMLGISSGTLQNLRVNGTLPYARVGRIIFYDQKDIAKLLISKSSSK